MEKQRCENKCGMTTGQRTSKHQRFSRAFGIFRQHTAETPHTPLPTIGDEMHTHQTYQLNSERWQQRISEHLRHQACRQATSPSPSQNPFFPLQHALNELAIFLLFASIRALFSCALMETFKSDVGFVTADNWKFTFFNYCPKANRGDCTRCKKEHTKSNARTAAKPPQCPSSPNQANQSTAEPASQNTHSNKQKPSQETSVSTRNKHGHDEETTEKKERKKSPLASSTSPKPRNSAYYNSNRNGPSVFSIAHISPVVAGVRFKIFGTRASICASSVALTSLRGESFSLRSRLHLAQKISGPQ